MAPSNIPSPNYAPLDALLDRLSSSDAELKNGLTNHAPMVVEALCALGRGDAAGAWLDDYAHELKPRARSKAPIDRGDDVGALGRLDRIADWHVFFTAALARAPWRDVLRDWIPKLAPGVSGAATHGVIRAAHAVRALAERDTPARKDECAAGLAYWAATFRALPLAGQETRLDALRALGQVPFVPDDRRRNLGSIDDALGVLADWQPFAPVGALLDVGRAPARVAADLTSAFARVLLSNARSWIEAIVFVHAITSSVAVTSLAAFVETADARALMRYGWQAAAALYSVYGARRSDAAPDTPPIPAAELIDDALATGDEHAIKCTEACLRAWRQSGDPALLAAARHATRLLARTPA